MGHDVPLGLVVGHGRRDNGNWDPGTTGKDGRSEHDEATEVAAECAEGLRRSGVPFVSEVEAAERHSDPNFQGSTRWINEHVNGSGLALSLHFDWPGAPEGGFGIHVGSAGGSRAARLLGDAYADAGFTVRYGGHVNEDTIGRHGLGFLNNTQPPAVIFECGVVRDYLPQDNRRQGEALAKGVCDVLGVDYVEQGTDDPDDGQPQRHYDVAVVYEFDESRGTDAAADHGPAWMLGKGNLYMPLERSELDVVSVDYAVAVGYHADEIVEQVGDGVAFAGATRYATWDRVLEAVVGHAGAHPDRKRPWAA